MNKRKSQMQTDLTGKTWCFLKARGMVLYSLLTILNSAILVSVPVLLGYFIDSIVYGGNVFLIFILLFGAALLTLLFNTLLKWMILKIARQQEQLFQIRLLRAFQVLRPGVTENYRNGEITMKFFRDAGTAGQFICNVYPQILNTVTGVLLATAIAVCKKPPMALIILFFFLLIIIFIFPCRTQFSRMNHLIRSMHDRSMNRIFEFMHIFPYLKSMAADSPYVAGPESKFLKYRQLNLLNDRIVISFELITRMVFFLGEYSILGTAGWFAWQKKIPVGDVVVFQVLFLSVFNSVTNFFQLIPSFATTRESLHSMNELLNSDETEDITAGQPFLSVSGNITASHVTFSYPNSTRKILDDFSCKIECGSITALAGVNGTGKTTLLKLLTGYLEPQNGIIEISGKNLSEWQKQSFRKKIAFVFQDELLITGTIRENITLKDHRYTDEEINDALRFSGADSLVKRMPDGLEHHIGFDGGGLSGGERQKVAIARAVIRKPELLILDEVTNHLDFESRGKMKSLLGIMKGKTTVLIVSHDPEILSCCDQIIELTE